MYVILLCLLWDTRQQQSLSISPVLCSIFCILCEFYFSKLSHAFFNFYFSEQGTPDEPTEKPKRRKKPKTPEPGVDQERAKENLGFENEAALDVEDVSTDMHVWLLILFLKY